MKMNSIAFAFLMLAIILPSAFAATKPPGIDLELTYINRAPMYERYRVNYPNGKPVLQPGTENARRWPTNGEIVTFTAHVINKGTVASGPFDYVWAIDGLQVSSGTHSGLAPDQEDSLTYQWVWNFQMDGERVVDDHTVSCALDPVANILETFENNNAITDRINACAFRITITPAMYATYAQPAKTNFPFSAENWLQRQIAAMNDSLARSIYPVTPLGATERVRINAIDVRTNELSDVTYDGSWFVNADYRVVSGGYDGSTDIDWSLVHELSHQVGLIDIYNYNVESDNVLVRGGEGYPCNFAFSWPRADLMGGGDIAPYTDAHLYSSFSAGGLSSTKGYRRGYYGEFQFDIAVTNFLFIADSQGQPAPDVQVEFFQRGSANDIDNVAEISGTTDATGRVLIANRSVSGATTTRTGHTLRDNPFGIIDVVGNRNVFLVRLAKGEHEEFIWLNLTDFNVGYWSGNTETFTLPIASHVPPPGAPPSPRIISSQLGASTINVCWTASAGAIGYYVYSARLPEYRYQRVSGMVSNTCFSVTGHTQARDYVVTAVDASMRESGFSGFVWAPSLRNPTSVGITPDGKRIVLDPQNGHALLEQEPAGRFIRNIGSVHYHLEYSRFLCIDSLGRLIISHPADFYSSRHSVRVASSEADALFEFGQRGSGPGQFETPAGIAVRGQPAGVEGPWPVDENTRLLLHFDGNVSGAQGENGTTTRTSFTGGKYGLGVLITNTASLTFPTAGNLERDAGALEFWFRPNWNGNDGVTHFFLDSGAAFVNGFRVVKDGANNLRFMLWRGSRESGVGYGIGSWQTGQWHHVAVTWTTNQIALYVDGQQRSSSTNLALPDALATTMYIGSSASAGSQANGVFDEFRISSVPRVGNSDVAGYTIFVADSGNHRIQAFDEVGNFLAAFGTLGTGPGQFNSPRGLAVDTAGNILVVDRNNQRIQVLSFAGTNFSHVRTFTSGFNNPLGVTAYRDSHWIVADTANNRIKLFNTNGTLLSSHIAPNDGAIGNFLRPEGVITDRFGQIIVADTGNQRIVTLRGLLPTNPPPRFLLEQTRIASGQFQSALTATPGQSLVVQVSTNLVTWSTFTNLTAISNQASIFDSSSQRQRFYRAFSP